MIAKENVKNSRRVFDESIELKDNAMLKHHPELFYEWDFERNDKIGLDIYKIAHRSGKKAWWLGECGHSWDAVVYSRTGENKGGCGYCGSQNLLVGFNDMWTTNSKLAELLANPEDGYKHMHMSHTKVDWKCLECENIVKNKSIYNINVRGLSCICSDNISFGEKYMYNLLHACNIRFKFDECQKWSERRRYDFYFIVKEKKYIVEVHGGQHYKESFKSLNGKTRTLKEEQENDRIKEELTKENGIDGYIVIDARESTVEWIKDSILNSNLSLLINSSEIDFEEIGRQSSKSLVKVVCDIWNLRTLSMAQIAEKVNISNATVIAYLKRGVEIGWCDYTTGNRKPIVQLTKDLELICAWNSSLEAGQTLGFQGEQISAVCLGNRKTTNGFRWMFKEDYEEYLSGDLEMPALISKHAKCVVQLDMELNLIKTYYSQSEAATAVGLSSSGSISIACKSNSRLAGGFRWMHKEDYDKMMEESL